MYIVFLPDKHIFTDDVSCYNTYLLEEHGYYIDSISNTELIILKKDKYEHFYSTFNSMREYSQFDSCKIYTRALNYIEMYYRNQKILNILAN